MMYISDMDNNSLSSSIRLIARAYVTGNVRMAWQMEQELDLGRLPPEQFKAATDLFFVALEEAKSAAK